MLGQMEARGVALDVNAEEEAELAEIFDSELPTQTVNNLLEQAHVRAYKHDVIDVQKKVGGVVPAAQNEQRRVRPSRREPDADDKRGEAGEPSTRHLTEAIERFVEEVGGVGTRPSMNPGGC